jgi:lipoprotein-anchoring transpeptidase ErfK/SrfK
MRKAAVAACFALWISASPGTTAGLDAQAVNEAQFEAGKAASRANEPLLLKAQVLLSRAHFSPGEIDAKPGANFSKALSAFARDRGLQATDKLNEGVWRELANVSAEPALTEYTIAEADVRGPFAAKIPARLEDMQYLPALSFVSSRELLAEKFHMSEALLSALNPGKKLDSAGERIVVVNLAQARPEKPARIEVKRIEVNKTDQTLQAFGQDGKLLAFYPVTAGSSDKPAPSGQLKVTMIKKNPTYRYNPEYGFKGVRSRTPFIVKPGPNNPVGAVWIGLSGEGYGLHGSPEPSKISKSESHGCIRLTNWDALELADAITKGIPVDFVGNEQERRMARAQAPRAKARGSRGRR